MEKTIISSKFVTIKRNFDGAPTEDDFEIITISIDTSTIKPGSNKVLVKCLQFSIDPYQLMRMKSYSPSQDSITSANKLIPGKPIDGYVVGKIVASGHPEFNKDDLVTGGGLSWSEYVLVENVHLLRKIDPMGFPLSYHVGIFGPSGITAYAGFFKVGKPKKGEKVFVSSAAGSVGNLVGQYAKLFGCYVVGSASTKEKVNLLKEKLGFDDAFNYTEESDLNLTLKRYFPQGIDIYFDNVGGDMLEAAVINMNNFGRIIVCGVISQYSDFTKKCAPNMIHIIYKRITLQGFLVTDYMDEDTLSDFISTTRSYLRAGQMQVLEDVSFGFESICSAFLDLFHGCNIGKKIVKIEDD